MQRQPVSQFLANAPAGLLIDVRSPAEFEHAHIPGAFNLPLFTNEERKTVGTLYKQQSREAAIKIALEYFGPKMRQMVETVEQHLQQLHSGAAPLRNLPVKLYCWRGGMRSGAVAWLLDLYGFNVQVLQGGYKAFRNFTLQSFEQPFPIKILGGYTGSGKTPTLRELEKIGQTVIDLENIAGHKGSAFGNIHLKPQPSQEMFENLLGVALRAAACSTTPGQNKPLWIEDESQRIGHLNIPNAFWHQMRQAPLVFVEIPFEERLKHIISEYGDYEKERLIDATLRISKRLGGLETKNVVSFLQAGNLPQAFEVLLHYYDKQYSKGLHNRNGLSSLCTRVAFEAVLPQHIAAGLIQHN